MARGQIADSVKNAASAPPGLGSDRVAAAWRTIHADPSIQFNLPEKAIPKREPPPGWLEPVLNAIGGFIQWVGGGWQLILWVIGIAIAVALLFALVPGLRDWLRERFAARAEQPEPQWAPTETRARALLEDADALAAAGRFDEAVHLLLFRSIDDIVAWRGDVVRPADTSRDIARADALPQAARGVFAGIVAAVERSLFGGHTLDDGDWQRARADYAGFALKGVKVDRHSADAARNAPLPGREGLGVGLPERKHERATMGQPTPDPSLPGRGDADPRPNSGRS